MQPLASCDSGDAGSIAGSDGRHSWPGRYLWFTCPAVWYRCWSSCFTNAADEVVCLDWGGWGASRLVQEWLGILWQSQGTASCFVFAMQRNTHNSLTVCWGQDQYCFSWWLQSLLLGLHHLHAHGELGLACSCALAWHVCPIPNK